MSHTFVWVYVVVYYGARTSHGGFTYHHGVSLTSGR